MTETAVQDRHAGTIVDYVTFWNTGVDDDQRRLASTTFAEDVEYHAPIGVLHAVESLIGFRNEFAAQMGVVQYVLREQPDVVGDHARLRWEIRVGSGSGTSFAEGTDVLAFDRAGRIASVTTFLDRAPVGFDPHAGQDRRPRREGRW